MDENAVVLRPAAVRLLWGCTALAVVLAAMSLAPLAGWHALALTRTAGILGLLLFGAGILVRQINHPHPGGRLVEPAFGVLLASAGLTLVFAGRDGGAIGGLLVSAALCGTMCAHGARHRLAPLGNPVRRERG